MDGTVFKRRLRNEALDLTIVRTKYALLVAFFVYPAFAILDYSVAPGRMLPFLLVRLGVLGTYGIGYLLLSRPVGRKIATAVSVGVVYTSALGIIVMIPYIGGFNSSYYIGVLMALVVAGLFMPWDVKASFACVLLILFSYFGINFIFTDPERYTLSSLLAPFFFLSGTSIFTIFANWEKGRTRRKDLLQRMQIEKNAEELKALDEAKMRFFSNVSHELRSPLMLILGPIESIREGREETIPPDMLEAMEANARRLLRQVNTLLDFAKMDSGRLQCNYAENNLGRILKELYVAAQPHARRRDITFKLIDAEKIPDTMIDAEKVETIAANLLSNAMKFTPIGGAITIRLGHDDDRLWFEIEDTGAGIPADQLEKVFERFLQVDDALSRQTEGTGLGLAMVKELTKLHLGRVTVDSTVGKGSTFRVELPRNPETKPVERRRRIGRRREDHMAAERTAAMLGMHYEKRASAKTLLADIDSSKLERLKPLPGSEEHTTPDDAPSLLYVEDNPDLRTFVANALSRKYRVQTADDGVEGLEAVRRRMPDLIISDVMMPRMDGYEFCRKLREDPAYRQVPVIMVTAKSGTEAVIEGLDIGANDYVSKPFELRELEARIEAHLRAHRLEKQLQERDSRLAAIGSMTSSIVHDLRNPLASILGFSQVVKADAEQAGSAETSKLIDPVVSEAKRLERMITEVLDFARGKAADLKPAPVVVRDFFETITEPIQKRLTKLNIELIIEHEANDDLTLNFDRDRMQRVFENLTKNAQEALTENVVEEQKKHIWITTRTDGDKAVIRIADDGPGIPEEIVETLFKTFTTSGKKSGTGLGLATVRNIVVAHGGEIAVQAKSDKGGAAFVMTFPMPATTAATH